MNKGERFKAMAQGNCDYLVDVFPITSEVYGEMMTIGAIEGAIYITKDQAMKFFGLVDPESEISATVNVYQIPETKPTMLVSDLGRLSVREYNALAEHNIVTVDDLIKLTSGQLFGITSMPKKSILNIEAALERIGSGLAKNTLLE